MPEGQQCAFPGCDEPVMQPACGGTPRLYCSHNHRVAARRLRSIARTEAEPAPDRELNGRSDPRPAWIANPFSLPQNAQQDGARMATSAGD